MDLHQLLITTVEKNLKFKPKVIDPYLSSLSFDMKGVQQSRYYLVGADPGVGKTTLVDQMFVLSPLLNLYEGSTTKININYWSLELPVTVKLMKWCSYFLWIMENKELPLDIFDGTLILSKENKAKFLNLLKSKSVQEFLQIVNKTVTFHTSLNADTIKFDQKASGDTIEELIIDHIGLVSGKGSEKSRITKVSKKLVDSRNKNKTTPIVVQQFNRTNNSVERQKFNPIPQRDDFKDSSNTYEDCDVAMGIINPLNFGKDSFRDIDLNQFKETKFRRVQIIKNRYGKFPAGTNVGLHGKVGWLYQLPKVNGEVDYKSINNPIKLKSLFKK